MRECSVAAVDLGAESGRVMRVSLADGRLHTQEIHRFANTPVRGAGTLCWDAPRLFAEIRQGLCHAAARGSLSGIGVDTWGVDFALLDEQDHLLENPFHHRDRRTDGMMEEAFQRMPREEIFERTGIQFLPINTLYQVLSLAIHRPEILQRARTFLTMPDLFHFWLTGRKACEYTNATTTQLYDARAGGWSQPLLAAIDMTTALFPEVVAPGTPLGAMLPAIAGEMEGLAGTPVIAPACHDTASAVAGTPLGSKRSAYISSGTWSLVGVEVPRPLITPQTFAGNFTNEGGVDGTTRLLKNVMGLWLLQECRRAWTAGGASYSYDDLEQRAGVARPFAAFVHPNAPEFLPPGDMPGRLRAYGARTGQRFPEDPGAVTRYLLEGLALQYRHTLRELETCLGWQVDAIYVVGGGSKNRLLCQMTANATGLPVVAGPVEATALGNAIVQMKALGTIASLAEGREIVRKSFPQVAFTPRDCGAWDEAAVRWECFRLPSRPPHSSPPLTGRRTC